MGRELWSSDLEAPIWSLSWGPEDRLVVGVSVEGAYTVSSGVVKAFEREARLLRELEHPT